MKNIYQMFATIVGTKDLIFERALVEAVDRFTKHTHENRFNVEGWKTNAGHMLNQKFIVDYMCEPSFRGDKLQLKYSTNRDHIEDLIKVLCNLKAEDYNKQACLSNFFSKLDIQPGTWYSWSFFEFKAFKKGTIHFKFQNIKDWEQLNRSYAKAKGEVLPEKL
jgi:hypothetical protein